MALTKISSNVIANNTIAVGNIADNSVDATKIASNSILTRHIDDDQITTDQIAANTIATANIADNAVDGTKIASNSILTRHIDDNQIGIDQLNVSDGSNGQMLTTNGSGTLSFSTPSSFDADAAQVFNESGAAVDFRIEGDTEQNLFFVDGSADKIGIGTSSPAAILDVQLTGSGDAVKITGNSITDFDFVGDPPEFNLEDSGSTSGQKRARLTLNDQRLSIQGLADDDGSVTHQFITCDLSSGNVGIGTTSPSKTFHIYNTAAADVGLLESTQTYSTLSFKSSTNSSTVTVGIDGAGNAAFENKLSSGDMTVVTNGSERMRIDSDGMWRGQLLNNSNTNPLGSGTNSGKLWSTSGNYINVWQVTNDAVGAHYWIEIDIQSLDGYTSYGEIYKDRNGRWRIVQHRQAGTNFQVSSDNNYIQVTQSSGADQTNSSGNLKLVRIPGATA
jgi:hypothetical protein